MTYLTLVARETWELALQAGPYLLGGFFLAGMIHAFLPAEKLAKWLGGKSWRAVFNAALVGVPLPLCSCSVVPVAAELRRRGASRGATTAFLISTPESGVESIAVTYALMDPIMTIARPTTAMATAFIAGIAQNRFNPDSSGAAPGKSGVPTSDAHRAPTRKAPAPFQAAPSCCNPLVSQAPSAPPPKSDCCGHLSAEPSEPAARLTSLASAERTTSTCCHATPGSTGEPALRPEILRRVRDGLRYGFITMFENLAGYLLIGFVIAGIVAVLLQHFDPLRTALHSPWAPLLMLAAGVPMYVCAASITPMIAVMISQGLSPGAGLVFLLVGPATNAASVVILQSILGIRGVVLYLVSIIVTALAAGYAVDALYAVSGITPRALVPSHVHHEALTLLQTAAAVVLALLVLIGLWRRNARRFTERTRAVVTSEEHPALRAIPPAERRAPQR